MNETTLVKGISAIGTMDGPTSVFLAGKLSVGVFAAVIAIGILIGFFGLKLVKVVAAFLGFLIGAGVGAGICALAGIEGIASVAVILVCAILLAVVIPAQSSVITIVELAVSLVLAILAAIFAEPMIIVITGIAGGFLAGPAILDLAGITDPSWLKYVAGAVLAFVGLMIQFMMQSSKIGKKERIKSEHIKEQVSMENEVEKARMILDEDEAEPEEAEEPEGYLDEEEAEEPEGYLDVEETEEPEGYLDEDEDFSDDESEDIEIRDLDLDDIPSDEESEE